MTKCKFCGEQPKVRMVKGVYYQYVCRCEHRTPADTTNINEAIAQWNEQNQLKGGER